MVLEAAQLLQQEGLGSVTTGILSFISILDRYGAWTWNLRVVGLCTTVFLYGIRMALKEKRGVGWYSLVHALVSGLGSMAIVYLDLFASEVLTGETEPLRSCQCQGPLTSLHRILPAITMGYSMLDLVDGLTISIDFAFHGIITFLVMAFFCELDAPHFIAPMLLMEVSTIPLTLVRADFVSESATAFIQASFAFLFFLFRIIVVPYVWFKLMVTMNEQRSSQVYQNCFPPYFMPVAFGFGMVFHMLNAFWFTKLVKKIRRKILGIEGVKSNNDLGEKELQNGNGHKKEE
jgi:hypothetical protein